MNKNFPFQEVFWEDVRAQVKAVNPELFDIIEQISPDKHYPLIKASYRFGDMIVKNGKLNLPTQTALFSIEHAETPKNIKSLLHYAKIPLGLILNKACKIFLHEEHRIIPLNVFYAGQIFGTFETLSSIFNFECFPVWNVSSVGTILFTLSKLKEKNGLNRLKKHFKLPSNLTINSIYDQFNLFKQIANSPCFNIPWHQEILFFTTN